MVIPAYSEEKNIENMLLRTKKTIKAIGIPCEIIVVDDGPTDKTRLLTGRHKATVLANGKNRGKGNALKRGFANAIGNIITTMDADGSYQPEEIPLLLKPLLNGTEIIAGSRFLGRRERGSVKRLHILENDLFNLLIWILTKKRITDSQTGFRAYKKTAVQEIEIISDGYDVETELTVKTLKNGYLVQEEPITCEKRKSGNSKLNIIFDDSKILETILRTYFVPTYQDPQ